MLQADLSYYLKFLGAVASFLLARLFVLLALNGADLDVKAPVGSGLGASLIHLVSFFSMSYPVQLASSPWWLDLVMWMGHVGLWSLYAISICGDAGTIPASDKDDPEQKRAADELVVRLAENGAYG